MGERATPEVRSQQTLWERLKDWRPGTTRHASRDSIAPSRREELLAMLNCQERRTLAAREDKHV